MIILVVENDPDRLWELVQNMRLAFPDDTVEYTHDPLMAGKFAINYTVDVLLAGKKMKRMDGLKLGELVRRKNPNVKLFLISAEKDDNEPDINIGEQVNGLLTYPITLEKLCDMASQYCSLLK